MPKGVNHYLETKWRNFFRFMDVDHDGIVTFRDYDILAKRFAELADLNDSDAENVRKSCLKWWWMMEKTVGRSTHHMSEDAFVDATSRLVTSQQASARKDMDLTWTAMFDVLDQDRDGMVTIDELSLFYRCHGITDRYYVENVFRNLDLNRDGFISREEFIQALGEFWFGENPNDDYSFIFRRKSFEPAPKQAKRCPWLRRYFCCCSD